MMKRLLLLLLSFTFLMGVTVSAQGDTRLRFIHLVAGGPNVDVLVNGTPVLTDVAPGAITDFVSIAGGSLEFAIVPTGEDVSAAIIMPTDAQFQAGHSHTLAALGQLERSDLTWLAVDEDAAFEEIESSERLLFIHNIAGGAAVNGLLGDTIVAERVFYRSFRAVAVPENAELLSVTAFGDTSAVVLEPQEISFSADEVTVVALFGSLPGEIDDDYQVVVSE